MSMQKVLMMEMKKDKRPVTKTNHQELVAKTVHNVEWTEATLAELEDTAEVVQVVNEMTHHSVLSKH